MDEKVLRDLESAIPKLERNNDVDFARSLLRSARRGPLSEKQAMWVERLIARANGKEQRETAAIGNLKPILALFAKAAEHLKFPKVLLRLNEEMLVRLSVATVRSRHPGTINVVETETDTWLGRIDLSGVFDIAKKIDCQTELVDALRAFAKNPARVASDYGRLTGRCCFCNLKLTDERSTGVGYGKICAEHFDLPWGERPEEFAGPARTTVAA